MPLNWKEPAKDYRTFNAEISGEFDQSTAHDAFVDAWRFFIREVVPLNPREDWDHFRFEFWPDSGRCIIFVAHSDRVERVDRGCCQLISKSLAGDWDKFATKYSDDDAKFNQAMLKIERGLMEVAVTAADVVAEGDAALCGVDVEFWNADSELLEAYTIG